VYNSYQTMNEQVVRMGTVESVRNVTIASPESGVGTMTGAALGGLGGSEIGGGKGSIATGIVGAVAGGLVGQHVEPTPATARLRNHGQARQRRTARHHPAGRRDVPPGRAGAAAEQRLHDPRDALTTDFGAMPQ
jgi:uncharacterized protein YcfJ